MFRIAILVNENEVAHSAFADTAGILKRPAALGDQKTDTYRFVVFDKYNVHRLFLAEHENHLLNFDSMVIATNATNNVEILNALREGSQLTEQFLNAGKGMLVCSQKKLSKKYGQEPEYAGFLPNRYEYCLYDRPEASSASGTVSITTPEDRIFSYPNTVTDQLIEYHCTNNSFMAHKYRSHIVPLHPSEYLPLLTDTAAPPVPEELRASLDPNRVVLFRSGSIVERIVISSMALDWAGHEELLENILVYITEGTSQIAVLRRRQDASDLAMDSYVIRARVAKIPIREYFDVAPAAASALDHPTLIISPAYSLADVEDMWRALAQASGRSGDLYHMYPDNVTGGFQLHQRSSSKALDRISATAATWLATSFFPGLWGKSIWTYNYVLAMMVNLGIDVDPYLPLIYSDICKHVPAADTANGSYDNVINASSQMLEILSLALRSTGSASAASLEAEDNYLEAKELYERCGAWILEKLLGSGNPSLRDRLYMITSLSRVGYIEDLPDERRRNVWDHASETFQSYRTQSFALCNTVEATQVLELTLALGAAGKLSDGDLRKNTAAIVELLRSRQGPDGDWRNISETAEVTLALLEISQAYADFASSKIADEAILRGVEHLLRNYDVRRGNWSDDINATAKAAHALALFDLQRGIYAYDFFADIQNKTGFRVQSEAFEIDLTQNGRLLAALFERETELTATAVTAQNAESRALDAKGQLGRYRVLAFGASVIALTCASAITLVFAILFGSYSRIATKIIGDWHDYIISAFVGIILTLGFMGIYGTAKGRILKREP